jgi:hypothetical protein
MRPNANALLTRKWTAAIAAAALVGAVLAPVVAASASASAADEPSVFIDDVLGGFRVGEVYDDGVSATGDSSRFFWLADGPLPAGISLEPDGRVHGTPTTAGPYLFRIVADGADQADSRVYSGTVERAWIPPHVTNEWVSQPQVGVTYYAFVFAEGDGAIVYTVVAGALPAWLTLDATTGWMTGTPALTDLGSTFDFTVGVSNEYGSVSRHVSYTVGAGPTATIVPDFEVGDEAAGATGSYDIKGGGLGFEYDLTVHSTPVTIAAGETDSTPGPAAGTASGTFTLPADLGAGAHRLVLTAYAQDGQQYLFTLPFTILADGTIGSIGTPPPAGPTTFAQAPATTAVTSQAALAATGTDAWIPGSVAVSLLALGGILMLRRRRLQQS